MVNTVDIICIQFNILCTLLCMFEYCLADILHGDGYSAFCVHFPHIVLQFLQFCTFFFSYSAYLLFMLVYVFSFCIFRVCIWFWPVLPGSGTYEHMMWEHWEEALLNSCNTQENGRSRRTVKTSWHERPRLVKRGHWCWLVIATGFLQICNIKYAKYVLGTEKNTKQQNKMSKM